MCRRPDDEMFMTVQLLAFSYLIYYLKCKTFYIRMLIISRRLTIANMEKNYDFRTSYLIITVL